MAETPGMSSSWRIPRAAICAVISLTALAGSGCLYDSDKRCGPAMTYVTGANACVCDSNAVAVPGGCQACAADEVAAAGKCACASGKTKSADNICVTVAGLGDPCNTTSAPCTDATYSYCAVGESGPAGTCTKTCTSNADCGATYTCARWEAQPYCRTFNGLGTSCATSADCTEDAKFCENLSTHTCVFSCSLAANDCPRDMTCCDFSNYGLGTLCAGACQ